MKQLSGNWVLFLPVAAVMSFLVAPTFIVIPMSLSADQYMAFPPRVLSLRWYEEFFTSTEWIGATWSSIKVGCVATILSLLLGAPAAWVLVMRWVPGRRLINAVIMWPLAAPVIVLALGLYGVLLPMGLLDTVLGLAVAHTVLGVPFVVITLSAALRGIDPSTEEAARNLGAGPIKSFVLVVLPQVKPALIAGALFAFLTSWDELVLALFISGTTEKTLPRQMWSTILFDRDPTLAAVATLLLLLSVIGYLVSRLLQSRSTHYKDLRMT